MASQDRIGELLLREKIVSPAQIQRVQESARRNNKSIAHELVKQGIIQESDLTSMLSRMHNVPSIELEKYAIPEEVLKHIPKHVAERHLCVPINRSGSTLVVAMAVGASIGSPATPGVGIVILAMVLQTVGIPPSGIALIMGVDRILDMCRTAINVTGDLVTCRLMENLAGKRLPPDPVPEETS